MTKRSPAISERLCNWAASLTYDQIPPSVLGVAVGCLVDTVGVAIAGMRAPVTERARSVSNTIHATGHCDVVGQVLHMTAAAAALVNATAAHAFDFDDNCGAGMVHGTAVVGPTAVAGIQEVNKSGKELLVALVAGLEVEYAVGRAAGPSIYEQGWFTSSIYGVAGAAVAAACAKGLDRHQMTQALCIAISAAGGMKACVGTDAKPLLLGRAAEAGIVAAEFARVEACGPRNVFEDPRGLIALLCDGEFNLSAIDEIGERWSLCVPGIDFKRSPVCLSATAALDGIIAIQAKYRLNYKDIVRIGCDIPENVRRNLPFGRRPQNFYEAQFSLPFVVGCALMFGDVELRHLDELVVNDPSIRAMMDLVHITTSARWRPDLNLLRIHPDGAFVSIEMRNGDQIEHFQEAGVGSVSCPMSSDARAQKFLACASLGLSDDRARTLLNRLESIADQSCIRDLFSRFVSKNCG